MRRAPLVILVLTVLVAAVVLWMQLGPSTEPDVAAVEPVSPASAADDARLVDSAETGTDARSPDSATRLASATTRTEIAAPPGSAHIAVRVISSEDGQPVPRVEVAVWPTNTEMRETSANSLLDRSGSTADERGEIAFALPADARYWIRAFSPKRWTGKAEAEIGPWKAGERVEVVLRVSTKPDLVFHGRVIGEGDAAIEGAHVSLLTEHDPNGPPLAMPADDLRVARSDADGAFVVELMSWRSATLLVEAEGHSIVAVLPGRGHETRELAAEIPLSRSGTIEFQASGARGAALAGATVRLSCESRDATLEAGEMAPNVRRGPLPLLQWSATLDGQGACTLRDVPVRHLLALALHEGVFERRKEPRLGSLEPGETRAIAWRIGGGCNVSGEVVDQDGKALSGQEVWLLPPGDSALPTIDREKSALLVGRAVSDARGRFQLSDVAAGSWLIGPPTCVSGPCDFYPLGTPLVIADGVEAVHVVVRVVRGLYVTGRVEDPDGKPLRGARVEIAGLPTTREHSGTGGVFRLGPLPPLQRAHVRAECTHCPFAPAELLVDVPGAPEPVVVRMRAGGSIAGVVRDASADDDVAASVWVTPQDVPGETRHATPRERGTATFVVERLPAGRYVVRAETDDHRMGQVANVQLADGASVEGVVIPVRAGATLRFEGTGIAGERRVHALVDGVAWDDCWIATEQDSCELRVPHGTVKLRMTDEASGALLGEQDLTLEAGETRTIEVARIGS